MTSSNAFESQKEVLEKNEQELIEAEKKMQQDIISYTDHFRHAKAKFAQLPYIFNGSKDAPFFAASVDEFQAEVRKILTKLEDEASQLHQKRKKISLELATLKQQKGEYK